MRQRHVEHAIDLHRDFMLTPRIRAFVENLRNKEIEAPGIYGYLVSLNTDQDVRIADELNKSYFRLVWGLMDDAVNKRMQADEESVFRFVFRNKEYAERVLEVGCGSGRLTKVLANIATDLVALDSDIFIIERCQSALSAERMSNVVAMQGDISTYLATGDFTAILLMENLLGMTLLRYDREVIYRRCARMLRSNGRLVISVRETSPDVSANDHLFQVMPYDPDTDSRDDLLAFGFARVCSLESVLAEIRSITPELAAEALYDGGLRSAGGRMRSAVLTRRTALPPT